MDSEKLMQIFQIAVYISIAIMVIGFGSAIFMFFKFDIPTVFALMTGRIQTKTVEKMMQTGDYYLGKGEEESYSEKYSEMTSGDLNTQQMGPSNPVQGETVSLNASMSQDVQETTVLPGTQETTVLAGAQETTVLGGAAETTVLGGIMETTVLGGSQFRQPQAPVLDAMGAMDMKPYYDSTERFDNAGNVNEDGIGETVALNPQNEQRYHFVSIEHTMLIHTDEVIS